MINEQFYEEARTGHCSILLSHSLALSLGGTTSAGRGLFSKASAMAWAT